mmetsp:Transcript_50284/g.145801  ORF Transcript_50284/g.145801 Transcript_50284/m.145801 type:complete len:591 (-) Transcript_50284:53-1825(-)
MQVAPSWEPQSHAEQHRDRGACEGRVGALRHRRQRLEASLRRRRQHRSDLQAALCVEERQRPGSATTSVSCAKETVADVAVIWQARLAALAEELRQKSEKVSSLRKREQQLEAELRLKLYEEKDLIPSLLAAASELQGAFRNLSLGDGGIHQHVQPPADAEVKALPCNLAATLESVLTSHLSVPDACSSETDLQPRVLFTSESKQGGGEEYDRAPLSLVAPPGGQILVPPLRLPTPGIAADPSEDGQGSPGWGQRSELYSPSGDRSPSSQSCRLAAPSQPGGSSVSSMATDPGWMPVRANAAAGLGAPQSAPGMPTATPDSAVEQELPETVPRPSRSFLSALPMASGTHQGASFTVPSSQSAEGAGVGILPPPRASLAVTPGPVTWQPAGPKAQPSGSASQSSSSCPLELELPMPPEAALASTQAMVRAPSARQLLAGPIDRVQVAGMPLPQPGTVTPSRPGVLTPPLQPLPHHGGLTPPQAGHRTPPHTGSRTTLQTGGLTPPQPCGLPLHTGRHTPSLPGGLTPPIPGGLPPVLHGGLTPPLSGGCTPPQPGGCVPPSLSAGFIQPLPVGHPHPLLGGVIPPHRQPYR